MAFPDDEFAVITMEATYGDDDGFEPIIVMINAAYVDFEHRDVFKSVLRVRLSCRQGQGGGLPSDEELERLDAAEDTIENTVRFFGDQRNALFLVRETERELRTIFFAVYDSETAYNALQTLWNEKAIDLPWECQIEPDQDWSQLQPYFEALVGSD